MSSTDASPEGGNSATFCCLDDPLPLNSSRECKTNPFPSKVQVFCSQRHSRQDRCHQSSGHKHSCPSNKSSSQCSSQLSELKCYQWNKFNTYGHSIDTHPLFQQICPHPLHYLIIVFLIPVSLSKTSDNKTMDLCCGWTRMGWEQQKGGK